MTAVTEPVAGKVTRVTAVLAALLLSACAQRDPTSAVELSPTSAPVVRPDPVPIAKSRTYLVGGQWDYIHVSEWKDGAGRFCTHTIIGGGREQALDCDWKPADADSGGDVEAHASGIAYANASKPE